MNNRPDNSNETCELKNDIFDTQKHAFCNYTMLNATTCIPQYIKICIYFKSLVSPQINCLLVVNLYYARYYYFILCTISGTIKCMILYVL